MYSNTAAFASARVRNRASWTRSVLSEAKKLSMGALSRQLPRRLIDCWIPCRSSTARYGPAAYWVDSRGRRNRAYVAGSKELVQSLGRCSPAQGPSRPAVEGDRHGRKVLGAVRAEVGALREGLAQQPVGVLVRAALPGAVGIAEGDLKTGLNRGVLTRASRCDGSPELPRSSRRATKGRPGEGNAPRPDRSERRFRTAIATSSLKVLRRPLEPKLFKAVLV